MRDRQSSWDLEWGDVRGTFSDASFSQTVAPCRLITGIELDLRDQRQNVHAKRSQLLPAEGTESRTGIKTILVIR
jgi:hypothetical protein